MRRVYLNNLHPDEAFGLWWKRLDLSSLRVAEEVAAEQALGRVTAEPVFAHLSSPHYHASAMDGYAVHSTATIGASERSPVHLSLGVDAQVVDTGDPLPNGCDAVIMVEDVQQVEGEIEIIEPASPWQHVRAIGEDMVASELILPAGHRIRPVDLGALLAGGILTIKVLRAPRVAIIPTGTEIVEPTKVPQLGEIIEYNSRVLAGLVSEWGGQPVRHAIVPDDYGQLLTALREAIATCDAVVINAGSSAGREDFTASLVEAVGELVVHGVALKPGKPTILGAAQGKPILGLPGYPVSAFVAAQRFLRPLLQQILGLSQAQGEQVKARLSRPLLSPVGMEEWVRVKLGLVGDKLIATPLSRGAGVIMSLVRADGLLRLPIASEGEPAGTEVEVELWRPREHVEKTLVVIGSHDTALDLLANHIHHFHADEFMASSHVGSLGGLLALARGEAHMAGSHLLDEQTGVYNDSYIQRYLPKQRIAAINMAQRIQGLMVAKGNPLGISSIRDLTREGVRFINRQRGAGTRVLLDYWLRQEQINPSLIYGYGREEFTHLSVAAAVSAGSADAALGILSAAKAFDLDFIPIGEESYELVIPERHFDQPLVQHLLSILNSDAFKREMTAMGGYDARMTGECRWIGGEAGV
ncbi:MAG: molybdopterin biosynthesis protein [Bacillota bacterium]